MKNEESDVRDSGSLRPFTPIEKLEERLRKETAAHLAAARVRMRGFPLPDAPAASEKPSESTS
jgi:hypothetical protein